MLELSYLFQTRYGGFWKYNLLILTKTRQCTNFIIELTSSGAQSTNEYMMLTINPKLIFYRLYLKHFTYITSHWFFPKLLIISLVRAEFNFKYSMTYVLCTYMWMLAQGICLTFYLFSKTFCWLKLLRLFCIFK